MTSAPKLMFRHEMSVHDVAMDPVGAGRVDRRDLFSPRRAKSAARIGGAMMISPVMAPRSSAHPRHR